MSERLADLRGSHEYWAKDDNDCVELRASPDYSEGGVYLDAVDAVVLRDWLTAWLEAQK